jgi:broad specificity phosphatase PhoE
MSAKLIRLVFLISLMLLSPFASANDTMIILVRHAEKASDDAKDPNLSERGMARANQLAAVLKDTDIAAVYATQYKRTQQTAQAIAALDGLPVQVREVTAENAKNYAADLVKEIKKKHSGEAVLIVGHSNTVPELVKYLTGKDITPIADNEFDRLYILSINKKTRLISTTYSLQ